MNRDEELDQLRETLEQNNFGKITQDLLEQTEARFVRARFESPLPSPMRALALAMSAGMVASDPILTAIDRERVRAVANMRERYLEPFSSPRHLTQDLFEEAVRKMGMAELASQEAKLRQFRLEASLAEPPLWLTTYAPARAEKKRSLAEKKARRAKRKQRRQR